MFTIIYFNIFSGEKISVLLLLSGKPLLLEQCQSSIGSVAKAAILLQALVYRRPNIRSTISPKTWQHYANIRENSVSNLN